jgi:hypothetical protein
MAGARWLFVGALLVACGGSTSSAQDAADSGREAGSTVADASSPGADAGDAASSSTPPESGAPAASCPGSEPALSSACGVEGLQCEYGDDPSIACNGVYACSGGKWTTGPMILMAPGTCPTKPASQTPNCPATFAAVQANGACSPPLTTCWYPEGAYVCVAGGTCAPGRWQQATPGTSIPGCPTNRPHLGVACSSTAPLCDYSCGLGPSGGVWCGAQCGDSNAFAVQCSAATGTWVEEQSNCAGC